MKLLAATNLAVLSVFFLSVNAQQKNYQANEMEREYVVIGVSGGLQDGFPDHNKLDYHSGQPDESKAMFLGRALVRGYKAYLDVMQEGWRQYTPEPNQPSINSVVLASGCEEHANVYWVYIVDARQVISVLNNEPRFLSITPDTGLIDLDAEETTASVRKFLRLEIERQGKTDKKRVALPIVTLVWFHDSFVPSPPIHTKDDGTEVTNFPDSLALWAGVDDSGRTIVAEEVAAVGQASPEAVESERRYLDGIRRAIRNAEANRPSEDERKGFGPPFECKRRARFGVGPETARFNRQLAASEVEEFVLKSGFKVDFEAGELLPLPDSEL